MTWTLLRKELRQHWLGLLAVLAAGVIGNLLILATTAAKRGSESPIEGLRMSIILMGTVGALVLNHRLVVIEYQARTQLFLEALPVARWRMVAVKYGLSLGTLLLMVGMSLAVACLVAWRHEGMTLRFVAILAARSVSAVWFAQSFCFFLGLTGRYRLALYLALLLGFGFLAEHKALEFSRFGPVALLDTRFAYEREEVPWKALGTTWALILVVTLLSAGLSLVREGSVAALLAEKMSHREKVFIAALICGLMFAASTLSEKVKKAPFDLKNAATVREPGVIVKVASGAGENDPDSLRLARHVATELAAMRGYLAMKELPPVFIVRRRDLDANRYERGELAKSEGVHVHANFIAKDWQDEPFLAWLVPELLTEASNGRAKLESKRWVLDGFGLFWVSRGHPEAALARDHALALRSLYGVEQGFKPDDLRRWLSFRDRVGEDIAAGVAWSGLKTLARREGPDPARAFLKAVLGTRESKDFRVMLKRTSWQKILREQAGESPEGFFHKWQEELASARLDLAGELARLPRLNGQVTVLPLSADSRKVRFRVILDPPPTTEVRYSFFYQRLAVFDEEISPKSLQREQNSYAQSPEAELPETYSRGQRLCWTVALDLPALGCQITSGFNRQEIP